MTTFVEKEPILKISKELKAGVLVVIAMVAFFVLFNFLKGENVFIKGRIFYVKYENVNGLAKSKPVTVNGLRIGRVDEIKIMDRAQPIYFVVKISIDRDIDFSRETTAEIYEPGFLSGKEIRLNLHYEGIKAEDGDTLLANNSPSITDILSEEIGPTKNKLDSLLGSVTATSNMVQKLMDEENVGNIKSVLRQLNSTVATFSQTANALSKTSSSANNLIVQSQGKIDGLANETEQTLSTAQNTLNKYGKVADKISEVEFEQTLKNFEEASDKLNNLLTKIDSDEGTLGAMLNDKTLYNNLNQTSASLDSLLVDFKRDPKRYVNFSVFGRKGIKK